MSAHRLYVLDYGLFEVAAGRRIGIQGFLVETADERVLVDTGFPDWYAADAPAAGRAEGLDGFGALVDFSEEQLVGGQLGKLGLAPADVTLLVLTHSDVDHVGGIGALSGVPIVVGSAERALPRPRYHETAQPLEWPEAEYRLVEADMDVAPGVRVLATPGHSPGHLSVLVRLPSGPVVLAGDAISRPDEVDARSYGENSWDDEVAHASALRLRELAAAEGAWIVYGHDPEQWPTLRKAPAYYD